MKSSLRRAAVVLLMLTGCDQPPATPGAPPRRRGPTVKAIVVTVQTTLQPANRTTVHTVVIARSKARSTDEGLRWRLYDFNDRTVTFVNELNGTYRAEPFEAVLARRRATLRRPVDRELPAAEFQATGAQREILTLPATQALIRLGGYQRELWFAQHPQIPGELFAMIHGSADPATRLGAISAAADDELLAMRGFPLIDRAELPYGNAKMVVERVVTSIQERDVPASLMEIPDGFQEVKERDANLPRALSRPPDRKAPAAGSPPSSTGRTAP